MAQEALADRVETLEKTQEQHRKLFANIGVQLTTINQCLERHEQILTAMLQELTGIRQELRAGRGQNGRATK